MTNPVISVIIPAYNREETIEKSVLSVVNQTFSDIEIIVIDDGSTDGTESVVENISDDRIICHKLNKNMGPSYARNYGVSISKGDYIAFHDSDDVCHENKLEVQYKKLISDNYDMVYCQYHQIGLNSEMLIPDINMYDEGQLDSNIRRTLIERGNVVGTPTMLIKKDIFNELGGFNVNYRSLEDYDLAIRISEKNRIGFVPECLLDVTESVNGVNTNHEGGVRVFADTFVKYASSDYDTSYLLQNIFTLIGEIDNDDLIDDLKNDIENSLKNTENIFDVMLKVSSERNKYFRIIKLFGRIKENDFMDKLLGGYDEDSHIGIYGAGDLGLSLVNQCKLRGYRNVCLIDRRRVSYDGIPCYIPKDTPSYVKNIIVTIEPKNKLESIRTAFDDERNLVNIFKI